MRKFLILSGIVCLTSAAHGQTRCFGLARGNCTGVWRSQLGYQYRIDDGPTSRHRLIWEFGPEISYPDRGIGIGGNLVATFDPDGNTQFGLKTRAFRIQGPMMLELGAAAFFLDSRDRGEIAFAGSAGLGITDALLLTATLDVIDSELDISASRFFAGIHLRRSSIGVPWPDVVLTVCSFVAAIIVSEL